MSIYHDRLSATWDKGLFLFAWAVGTGGLLALKMLGRSGIGLVLWTALVLLAYAAVIWRSPTFKVREDRAGDSCYYLGFLFTLSSLAYALWEFSKTGNDPRVVIGNFAVALSSTILGLVLRVTFQQMREDPFEVEQEVRLELAEAARRLKDQVLQSVEEFGGLRTAIGQELRNEFKRAVTEIANECAQAVKTNTTQHSEAVARALQSVEDSAGAMKTHVVGVRTSSKRLVDALEQLAERVTAADPSKPLEQMSLAASTTATAMQGIVVSSGEISNDATALARVSKEITLALTEWQKSLSTGSDSWKTATQAQREAIQAQLLLVERAALAVQDLHRSLTQAVGDSQKAVAKTHSSLASLADAIAERV